MTMSSASSLGPIAVTLPPASIKRHAASIASSGVELRCTRSTPASVYLKNQFTLDAGADRDGLVVFEQQPSGLLGTAAPDGSHRVMLARVGALQGTDLPVASSDGRYLVNLEGQLKNYVQSSPDYKRLDEEISRRKAAACFSARTVRPSHSASS